MDSLDVLDELNDEQAAMLFRAIRSYQKGEETNLTGLMKAVFLPFKNKMDAEREKYETVCERNKANGKSGGRPRNDKPKETQDNPVGYSETQSSRENPDTDTGTETDTEKGEPPLIPPVGENTPPAKPKSYSDEFEEVWRTYEPHGTAKGSKQPASKFYEKSIKEGVSHEEIIKSIRGYCQSCKASDTYTKHLSSWLGRRGWEGDWTVKSAGKQNNKSGSGYTDRLLAASGKASQSIQPVVSGREWHEKGCGDHHGGIDAGGTGYCALPQPVSASGNHQEPFGEVGDAQTSERR